MKGKDKKRKKQLKNIKENIIKMKIRKSNNSKGKSIEVF